MKNVLITSYACNPFKGSEDGTGWNIAREIAKTYKVTVITRKNNIPHIQKYLEQNPESNMEFHGFDLPNWILWLKKRSGERGYVLYFYLWQLFIPLFIKRKKLSFDILHSLNFHSDSHPNFLWLLGKPTFWGPVGHHPPVKKDFILPTYGWRNYLKDRVYNSVKWSMRNLDPFYRLAVRKTKGIFVINSSVASKMGADPEKVTLLHAVACEQPNSSAEKHEGFNILSVGRFHYIKGFDIVIRAFAKFYCSLNTDEQKNTKLTLVGKGEEKERLQEIANEEGINHAIEWISWVDKLEMPKIYNRADVFLFPSHEGAGMVVPEAMSYGLPVICFDNVGPGELCDGAGLFVHYSDYNDSVDAFVKHLQHLYEDDTLRKSLGKKSIEKFREKFTWKQKSDVITAMYQQLKPSL